MLLINLLPRGRDKALHRIIAPPQQQHTDHIDRQMRPGIPPGHLIAIPINQGRDLGHGQERCAGPQGQADIHNQNRRCGARPEADAVLPCLQGARAAEEDALEWRVGWVREAVNGQNLPGEAEEGAGQHSCWRTSTGDDLVEAGSGPVIRMSGPISLASACDEHAACTLVTIASLMRVHGGKTGEE